MDFKQQFISAMFPKTRAFSRLNREKSMELEFTPALSSDETCSITMDAIDANPSIHGFEISYPPLRQFKDFKCVCLPCSHRFNGMALLVHFSSRSMTCPLCRSGFSEDAMDFLESFRGEPWLEIMQNITMQDLSPVTSALHEAFLQMRNALHQDLTAASITEPDWNEEESPPLVFNNRTDDISISVHQNNEGLNAIANSIFSHLMRLNALPPSTRNNCYNFHVVLRLYREQTNDVTNNSSRYSPAAVLRGNLSSSMRLAYNNNLRRRTISFTTSSQFASQVNDAVHNLEIATMSVAITVYHNHNSTDPPPEPTILQMEPFSVPTTSFLVEGQMDSSQPFTSSSDISNNLHISIRFQGNPHASNLLNSSRRSDFLNLTFYSPFSPRFLYTARETN